MLKKIFIINGSGGKGKDQFVKYCSEFVPTFNISSVDKVKEAAEILGWNGGKTEKDRLFLARIKFDSSDYNDNPYEYMKERIIFFRSQDKYKIMFLHIREPEEIERVKNDFNCRTVLVKNINVKDITSNAADANVYNYNYDYVISNNDDLKTLKTQAYNFVEEITNEQTKIVPRF